MKFKWNYYALETAMIFKVRNQIFSQTLTTKLICSMEKYVFSKLLLIENTNAYRDDRDDNDGIFLVP